MYIFRASSNSADTTRITFTADISFSGGVDFSRDNDNVDVFSSLTLNAEAYTMGWRRSELGGYEYRAVGTALADHQGYAYAGYDPVEDSVVTDSRDWFDGQIAAGSESATVSVSQTAEFESTPDQIIKLYLNVMARSIIEFIGMSPEYSSGADTSADIYSVDWSISAEDPDHPGAVITIEYIYPNMD